MDGSVCWYTVTVVVQDKSSRTLGVVVVGSPAARGADTCVLGVAAAWQRSTAAAAIIIACLRYCNPVLNSGRGGHTQHTTPRNHRALHLETARALSRHRVQHIHTELLLQASRPLNAEIHRRADGWGNIVCAILGVPTAAGTFWPGLYIAFPGIFRGSWNILPDSHCMLLQQQRQPGEEDLHLSPATFSRIFSPSGR